MLNKSYRPAAYAAIYAEKLFWPFVFFLTTLLLNGAICAMLLTARRPIVPPQNLEDILAPLAPVVYTAVYGAIGWFPAPLQANFFPLQLQYPLTAAGAAVGVIGRLIALWSVVVLGRSFGIFVMVRKTVFGGPYRYVRHPMYLGFVCILAGYVLSDFCAAMIILAAFHVVLLVYRARIEERRLCEHSAEYREYMKRTSFLLPGA